MITAKNLTVKKGTTSYIAHISIEDSSVTTGAGLTGLVYNTANLTAYYIRPGDAAATQITLVDATIGTYASGGFKEVSSANMPGAYELHIPDACLAAGAGSCTILLKGATNMRPARIDLQLVDNIEKDTYDIVAHASYGNAQLVRSATPANALAVDGSGKVANNDKAGYSMSGTKQTLDALNDITAAAVRTEMDNNSVDLNIIIAYVDDLESRLTAVRAGYLDNLSGGAAALQSDLSGVKAQTDKLQFNASNYVKSTHAYTEGTVAADAANGGATFKTNLPSATNDAYKDMWVRFKSGSLAGQVKRVTAYSGATAFITVSAPFTDVPAPADTFELINE